jgi:hypothetical protein
MICRPNYQRVLGVDVLAYKNKCLVGKWLFKLLNKERVWQEFLCKKYLHSKTLSQVSARPTDCPFWKSPMSVKSDFFKRGSFEIGNVLNTRSCEDVWLGNKPLSKQYPSLYSIIVLL